MRILLLVTEAYGGHGGIAQYGRDLIDALVEDVHPLQLTVLPRLAEDSSVAVPAPVDYRFDATGGMGAYLLGVLRVLFGSQGYDLILCGHINLLPFAALLKLRFRAPLALFIYGIDAWRPRWKGLLRWVTAVVSISDYTAKRFARWSNMPPEAIHLLPNAIHLGKYGEGDRPQYLLDRYGLANQHILLTLGRLSSAERYKGIDEVIELLPRLVEIQPTLCYLVVGDGDDRARLEQKALAQGVADRVRFVGRIDEAEKADHYRMADAFTMAGHGEGFGFVFLEAMACGIPVLASAIDGSREAVRDGQIGQLVDPRDRDALLEALSHLLTAKREIPEGLDYFSFRRFRERLTHILNVAVDNRC